MPSIIRGTDTFDSAVKVYGFKNHIINGGFNVNQYPAYTATDGYKVDRWVISGATNISVANTGKLNNEAESNMGFNFIKNGTGDSFFTQRIEFPRRLAGKTITVSFATYSDVSMNADIYFDGYNPVNGYVVDIGNLVKSFTWGTGWAKRYFTFTLPSLNVNYNNDGSYLALNIRIKGGSTTTGAWLTDVQLEQGSVATPFEQRPYGLELSLCQRYYWKSEYFRCDLYVGATADDSFIPVKLPQTMRTAPTVAVSNMNTSLTGVSYTNTSRDFIIVYATNASTAGSNHYAVDAFTLSAEL